jgi:hypothetical protein
LSVNPITKNICVIKIFFSINFRLF